MLIEGPCDLNGRFDELALPHSLPIAVFSYLRRDTVSRTAWSPFCDYSPEWVAITAAREVGAEARFCDLPSWHDAFLDVRNRYTDRRGAAARERADRYVKALCERLAVDDGDALWDHLFEQEAPEAELRGRLDAYFERLRGDAPAVGEDIEREDFMARSIAWAMRDATRGRDKGGAGDVVVVCGGYHAPALIRTWKGATDQLDAGDPFPTVEPPPEASCGSYLVPYSYKRLDAFAGYEAGMPSPAFYETLWAQGPDQAVDQALETVVERLRKKKQPVSTADLIAATSLTRGLARLRGHESPARTDLLDAIAGSLLKEGLEVPLPWSRRGPLLPHTDPMLVEVVAALSGERRGRLAPATPRPPLVEDVRATLERLDLEPPRKKYERRDVELVLTTEEGRESSRVLHRLRVLAVPGFERLRGPGRATEAVLEETWRLGGYEDTEAALIEASGWGATLEGAAVARLEYLLAHAGELSELARLLGEAVFVGVAGLAMRVLSDVAAQVVKEPSFAEVGAATRQLFEIWRHDALFGAAKSDRLGLVLAACHDRGLWLVEGLSGETAPAEPAQLSALAALRDLTREGADDLEVSTERAEGVFGRRAVDTSAPPAIRGGCLGALWSLGHWRSEDTAGRHAIRALRAAARPETLGDFLTGLFALAREEVLHCETLLAAVDEIVVALGPDAFLRGLPALRLAFSYFPPLEREALARFALKRHGGDASQSRALLRLDVDPAEVARGAELDAHVAALAARYGLCDDLDEDDAP